MTKTIIVGFHGEIGAGKNTVATLYRELSGDPSLFSSPQVEELAFATHLKRAVQAVYGVTEHELTDRILKETKIKRYGMSPRDMCKRFGTEYGREQLSKDHWIQRLNDDFEKLKSNGPVDILLITDVRFPNEADWVRNQGGIVVLIDRPGLPKTTDTHSSSIPLTEDKIDYILKNHGDVDNYLRKEVEKLHDFVHSHKRAREDVS